MAGLESLRAAAARLEEREAWAESVDLRAEIAGNPDSGPWDRFFHARALLYAGKLDEAEKLIATLPGDQDPAVIMLKADLKERLSDHRSAEQLWEKALNAGGPAYWGLFGRARALFQLQKYSQANEIMQKAFALEPGETRGLQFARTLEQALALQTSILTDSTLAGIRTALANTYFEGLQPDAAELEDHTRVRFEACATWFVPWVKRYADLPNAQVVEIGCGTGSTTAALALNAKRVDAYDIDARSVAAARLRAKIMKLDNAEFYQDTPDALLRKMVKNHAPQTVDCIVLFAVLEHQLYGERIATLKAAWNMLKPGGHLVIADTPNRLGWHDFHTAWLPFFNMLPDDLAVDYAKFSSRADFRDAISAASAESEVTAIATLARLGRGVSYHEFEIALGDVNEFVVGDGFDPEPLAYFGLSLETRLLYTYMRRKPLRMPAAFTRDTLEVILRKPDPRSPTPRIRSLEETDLIVRPLTDTPETTTPGS